MAGFSALAVGIAACATLGLNEHFEASAGPLPFQQPGTEGGEHLADADGGTEDGEAEAQAGEREGDEDDNAFPLFKASAPPGFAWVAGEPVVQVGYGHRIVGRVSYYLEAGRCDPAGGAVLGQDAIFARLRERAEAEGGNAVIYARVHGPHHQASDCERIKAHKENGYPDGPWASGVVVWLEDAQWDEDGGVADPEETAAQRAARNRRRGRREDELPPPIDRLSSAEYSAETRLSVQASGRTAAGTP